MNIWNYHDTKMQELKQLYNKISKQTQNRLQELLNTFNFTTENIYNIADNKTKKRINTYIEGWKEQGLLKDNNYFRMLANNIYRRTRVKNSEILKILIYSAYIEEQNKIEKQEEQIMYEDANYYYEQGQQEVNKKKKPSILAMALFLALLDQPNYSGFNWKQYIETTMQYNAQQIYKQAILNIQQQKNLEIDSNEFQIIINRQNNQKLNINNEKISGAADMQMIGLNNLAKVEGIKSLDKNARVKFVSDKCDNVTPMCMNMDGMIFNVNDYNDFTRYIGTSLKDIRQEKLHIFGLVQGINAPPINNFFHWCHSYLIYVKEDNNKIPEMKPLIKQGLKTYTEKELKKLAKETNNIVNKYTNNKSKWSGKIIIDNKRPSGKLWNCNIRISNETAPHILLHEQLHAHSISYFDKNVYDMYGEIEEATVQLYAQEISKKEGIHIIPSAYDENVNILKEINKETGITKTDFEFAKILFEKPVNQRIDFLEDKIHDIMQTSSIEKYIELNSLLDNFRR